MNSANLRRLLSDHWHALFVAVVVACLAGLPQVILRDALGADDHGIPYLVNDSEGEYLGRVHEILDGHFSLASPMLHEYKDSVSLVPPTGEFIFYALPAKVTGLPLSSVVFASKFLYPALLFFFAYLCILSLLNRDDRGSRISAIAGALLIVIGYDAYDYRNFVSIILHGTPEATGLLWNRLVNPITGGMLLFAFLWLLSWLAKEKVRWRGVVIAGLVLAAMSGYLFSFALGLAITSILGLYFVWRRNWQMTLRIYIPVVIALALNATYFSGVFLAMRGATPLSDPLKAGMLLTREPLVNLISLVSLIGVLACFALFYRRDASDEPGKRWWFFLLATLTAAEAVYSQQLITGRAVWPQHFVQYTTPLSMAALAVLSHNIIRRYSSVLWRVVTMIFLVIAALFGWRGFEAAVVNTMPRYAETQEFAGVFEYLRENAPEQCVVYVSSDYLGLINRFLPGFTHCDIYHSFYIYTGFPSERIMHNYLVNLRLRGVALGDVKEHFFSPENLFFSKSYFYRDWDDVLCCGGWMSKIGNPQESEAWFVSVEKDVERRYKEYLKEDLYAQLTKYRLDYFVVDTELQPQVNDVRYPFLSLKARFGRFAIYALSNPSTKK